MPIFRSLLLPAIAVVLNVVTVLAAFGVLVLAFQGSAPLGGPGYLDAIITMGVVAIIFGLSIHYTVFLISRTREGYALTGSTEAAIEYGLKGTARIVTGAALIMSAVFLSLAISGLAGPAAWWLPAWLDRLLSGGEPPVPASDSSPDAALPSTEASL